MWRIFFSDKYLFLSGSKSLIFDFEMVLISNKKRLRFGARSNLNNFEIVPDINIIWHQFVEYSLKGGPGQWSRYMSLTQFGSRVGIDIYLIFFLQIYKLSGSYIKECKNHFQKFENFFEIPVFWEFRVWSVPDREIRTGSSFKLGFKG